MAAPNTPNGQLDSQIYPFQVPQDGARPKTVGIREWSILLILVVLTLQAISYTRDAAMFPSYSSHLGILKADLPCMIGAEIVELSTQ